MAIIKHSVNVLDLWIKASKEKAHRIRIPDPEPNLSREEIQSAADEIIRSNVLDFNEANHDYRLVKAQYYRRRKRTVIR